MSWVESTWITVMLDFNRRKNGFTLIEVLVALSIFSIAIMALHANFQSNSNSARRLNEKTLAHWVAQNKIVDLNLAYKASGVLPSTAVRQDKVEFSGLDWLVKTHGVKTMQGLLLKVEVVVSLAVEDTEQNSLATLETYFVAK